MIIMKQKLPKRKKILLTGASGTVGFEVLKQLYQKREQFDITVFDVDSTKSNKLFKPFSKDIRIVYGTISDKNDLIKACYDIDFVIHLAAIIPPLADDNHKLAHEVNVVGTQNLVELLELHSPNAFLIYSSSISVYGDRLANPFIKISDPLIPSPRDEYAITKIQTETIIQNSTLDWTIFRLAAIMGGHKVSKLMFHQPLQTSLEIASPSDTARAFVNAIEKQNLLSKRIFNLGGGENCRISYHDFLARSFEIYGLGKANFAPKSFAEKNFHCGYYQDGDVLNSILNFREDSINSYFETEKNKVSEIQKIATSLFRIPIKHYLQKQSEPLAAFKDNNVKEMQHYFIQPFN